MNSSGIFRTSAKSSNLSRTSRSSYCIINRQLRNTYEIRHGNYQIIRIDRGIQQLEIPVGTCNRVTSSLRASEPESTTSPTPEQLWLRELCPLGAHSFVLRECLPCQRHYKNPWGICRLRLSSTQTQLHSPIPSIFQSPHLKLR